MKIPLILPFIRQIAWRVVPCMVAIIASITPCIQSEEIAELDKARGAIIDSITGDDILSNPKISPADSSFISYEISSPGLIKLFVYNIDDSTSCRVDSSHSTFDMAWCPVPINRQIWGVYIRRSDDSAGMYLYNALEKKSYPLVLNDSVTIGGAGSVWGTPQWSPDGKCLTYTFGVADDADIYIITGMTGILQNPAKTTRIVRPQPLIKDNGDQFGAVWNPVPGAAYLAYNELGEDSTQVHIRIFDLFLGRKYVVTDKSSAPGNYAPQWNADGTRLGYFNNWNDTIKVKRDGGPHRAFRDLGFSDIIYSRDSLATATVLPIDLFPFDTARIKVMPDHDWLHGPTWLPSGRHLLATLYEGSLDRNMQSISLRSWRQYYKYSDLWLGRIANNVYDSIRDIDIVNLNISFVYKEDTTQYLYKGALAPRLDFYALAETAKDKARNNWWNRYAGGDTEETRPGFFSRAMAYLWKPIAGPDIIINKRIVPVVGGLALLVAAVGNGGDNGPSGGGRNWQPPQFPSPKGRIGFGVKFGM